jgi:hypothetical protein
VGRVSSESPLVSSLDIWNPAIQVPFYTLHPRAAVESCGSFILGSQSVRVGFVD